MRNEKSNVIVKPLVVMILLIISIVTINTIGIDKVFNTSASDNDTVAATTTTNNIQPYHMDNKRVVAASSNTMDFKLVYKYPDPVIGQNVPPDTTTTKTKPKKAAAPKNSDTITTTTNKKGVTQTIETKVEYINGVKHVTKTYLK